MSLCRRLFPVCFLALAACRPDFGLPVSVVVSERILSVHAQPPEVAPGGMVHLSALVAGPDGPRSAPLDFGFCAAPRPLTENNVVSGDCLGAGAKLRPLASGATETDAKLPDDACLLFGPETPPQAPGAAPLRPRDPDVTGGYYQPVRVATAELEAIALVRVQCNLLGASAQRAVEFHARYPLNLNPTVSAIELTLNGTPVAADEVPLDRKVTLRVHWPEGTAEDFVVHDRATDTLAPQRETLRVSWFTTGGVIPVVTTGRGEADEETFTETTWETPAVAGPGTLWAVLRDSRGGEAAVSLAFSSR